VPQGFFNTLNPFMHSEMQFKQHKIVILCRFMSSDSDEKDQNIEQLDNAKITLPIMLMLIVYIVNYVE
jgi:hypothetical protein